jgi:DNA-binding NarL/FixJ family response regulator
MRKREPRLSEVSVTVRAQRSPSELRSEPLGPPIVPSAPHDLVVRTFRIGSEEYALFSFSIPSEGRRFADDRLDALSPTERSIASLALRGLSNVAIGRARGTTARTIANQLSAIYRKLGVGSRRELCARIKGAEW